VNEAEGEKEDPEFNDVENGFVGEGVIEANVGAKEFPFGDEDGGFKQEEQNGGDDAPMAVDESSGAAVEPGEITVWIPGRERNVRDVDFGLSLGAAAALGHELLAEGKVFLLRGSVPEVVLFHVLCEEPDVFRSDVGSCLRGVEGGDFVERANSVEELSESPLGRLEAKIICPAALEDAKDRLAIEDIFADDEVGIEAWAGVARETRLRDFG
jgi:hypothetical protein